MSEQLEPLPAVGDTDEGFASLIEEIIARLHAGERVACNDYYARCPKREAELRQLLPSLTALADIDAGQQIQTEDVTELGSLPLDGQLGDFRLLREIARGGMGIVYEAQQISLRRRVALKVLPLAGMLNQRQLQWFRHEAQAAAGLHHTEVVTVSGSTTAAVPPLDWSAVSRLATVYVDIARSHQQAGQTEDAEQAFRSALNLITVPLTADKETFMLAGSMLWEIGAQAHTIITPETQAEAYWQALRVFTRGILAYPDDITLLDKQALACRRLGVLLPEHREAALHAAIEIYTKLQSLDPAKGWWHFEQAICLLRVGKKSEAVEGFSKAIALNPSDLRSLEQRGLLYLQDGLLEKAEADLKLHVEQTIAATGNHASVPTYVKLGEVLMKLERWGEAAEMFSTSIELNPSNIGAYQRRGTCYLKLQQHRRVVEDYSTLTKWLQPIHITGSGVPGATVA